MIGWLAQGLCWIPLRVSSIYTHAMDYETRSYNRTSQVLQTSQVSRASLYHIHPVASRTEHSNDVRAYLWCRLIYRDRDRDAHRTTLCFHNVLGSYSNLA